MAMASHKNISSLKQRIMEKAKIGMETVVHEEISVEMQSNITKEVYNKYNPLVYHDRRKYSSGGLADENSIVGKVEDGSKDSFTYRVRNEAKGHNKPLFLAPLIILGQYQSYVQGVALYHNMISSIPRMLSIPQPSDFTPYYEPRDFITPTKEYVKQNRNQLTRQLENFMNR